MKFDDYKDKYDNIEIPDNIEEFISKGIDEGKKSKKKKNIKILSTIAASVLIVIFTISIRISPAFADMVRKLPLGDAIVRFISDDKGLQLAQEYDYIQHVGKSDEQEGLVLTVDDFVMDQKRVLLFYSIENKGDHKYIGFESMDFYDENGNRLFLEYNRLGYSSFPNMMEEENRKISRVKNVYRHEDIPWKIPEEITMKVKFKEWDSPQDYKTILNSTEETGAVLDSTWEVTFKVNKEKFEYEKKVYDLNKEIDIAGQKVTIAKLIQHPITTEVEIEYDEKNSKYIFDLYNFRVIDEKGEYRNSFGGEFSKIKQSRIIESNYLNEPKDLTIAFDGIYAVDKDNLQLNIDIKEEKILNPIDDKLKIIDIEEKDDVYNIELGINFSEEELNNLIMSSSDFAISSDDGISTREYGKVREEEKEKGYNYFYKVEVDKDKVSDNIIKIPISYYPNIIKEDIRIKVK
ncbi:DUF4179 domain-containing protein [Clostridium sp. D2Q-11]|uniref:DUF4179 domain-containing protein n=1 Tax=Anaeromonas frigoriresistens TaxID=2683708 RepID=A0A942Z8M7_9FIRM|nr:DUF4179 domain-containing protein [Anaeromonas frigoriresistens]MBS4538070.1 DUF4179 domain-containing protein [Anaeromonas frigoriresistens]